MFRQSLMTLNSTVSDVQINVPLVQLLAATLEAVSSVGTELIEVATWAARQTWQGQRFPMTGLAPSS